MTERRRLDGRVAIAGVLLAGLAAVFLAMLTGVAPDLLALVAGPPPILRAALSGLAIVVGGRLLLGAIRRIERSMRRDGGEVGSLADADLGVMVRGVRLVFLAAASFTAAVGWLLAEPLPLVIALVIAGVDVLETSFLLLVATSRRTTD
ncbi:MAG TPA: hypothetical protein VHR16_11790 [Candidatus Limnocylindrales bacterium]|nr:hypothetical protein [Candidatus Limnocylindrales bacterium]